MCLYKILLVDDEILSCKFIRKFLIARGHNVSISSNVENALVMLESDVFEIILLDIRMPGLDGMEALRRIRKINTQVIVIMLSALSEESVINDAFYYGADYFMVKPADITKLVDDVIPSCILKRSRLS